MNVNSVMSTYNMGNLWTDLNPSNSSSPNVPLIDDVNSSVQEQYTAMNYFGSNTNTELQDIFQQVEPTYGISLTYNQSGDLTIPTSSTLPTNGLTQDQENVISLLQTSNSAEDTIDENLLSQYNSVENGTINPNLSSILPLNSYNNYSSIDSLTTSLFGNTGSYLDSYV